MNRLREHERAFVYNYKTIIIVFVYNYKAIINVLYSSCIIFLFSMLLRIKNLLSFLKKELLAHSRKLVPQKLIPHNLIILGHPRLGTYNLQRIHGNFKGIHVLISCLKLFKANYFLFLLVIDPRYLEPDMICHLYHNLSFSYWWK